MNKKNSFTCPVCHTTDNSFYIKTNALMHEENKEIYNFNLCNLCETVFLTNPVSISNLSSYYTDNYLPYKGALAWGKYSSFVEKSQRNLDLSRLKIIKKILSKTGPESSILDVACGNPSFLEIVKQKLNVNTTGIDFSDLGWQNKNFSALKLIKVAIEDFQTDELFDVITLWHYLEHDYNPQKTIEKLHQLLKSGGKIVIEVPDYKSITARNQKEYWQGWHSPRHISLFSKKSFDVLFDSEKWKIVEHKRHGTLDAFTLWWLGKMEQQNINWSQNMETHFFKLVFLKIVTFPFFALKSFFPLGIQILIVEKK
jgi:SAM-dependent methyltransferase